jgi:hypothetical protein
MGLLLKLKNGDTQLKSLKFGNDRPLGESNEPFVTSNPPENITPNIVDFVFRGGEDAPRFSVIDKLRLTKFFESTQGRLFVQKQDLLSQISPKTEASVTYGRFNAGIYDKNSTLEQALKSYKGEHLNKQGQFPQNFSNSLITYQQAVTTNALPANNDYGFNESEKDFKNRLLDLWNTKIIKTSTFLPTSNVSSLGGLNSAANVIFQYDGGPNSDIDGKGITYIKFATLNDGLTPLRTGINNIKQNEGKTLLTFQETLEDYYIKNLNKGVVEPLGVSDIWKSLGFENYSLKVGPKSYELDYQSSKSQNNYNSIYLSGSLTPRPDITGYLVGRTNNGNTPLLPPSYITGSLIPYTPTKASDQYNIYTPGAKITNTLNYDGYSPVIAESTSVYNSGSLSLRSDILTYKTPTLEKIVARTLPGQNDIPVYTPKRAGKNIGMGDAGATRGSRGTAIDEINSGGTANDYVNFRIGIVGKKEYQFRSLLASVSDTFTANWKEQSYLGRGEKFYKYTDFGREMSINFKVVALSEAEMGGIYTKLNYIASSLAPDYTSYGYMAGNIAQITLGKYVRNQYGIIKNLSYSIPEESVWDIDDELPLMIDVQMSFTPIHNFRPQIGKQFINQ